MTSLGILRSIIFVLSVILSQPTYAAQLATSSPIWDDGGYSSCAVTDCFVPVATNSGCDFNDNSCICTTTSFVTQVATCLGQNCSAEVSSTYSIYKSSCQVNGGYSLALNMTQFLIESGALSSYLSASFWDGYPACSIDGCLVLLTAASGCEVDDHECVCLNSTLLLEMAGCIGKACTNSETRSVYTQYSSACSANGGYSLNLSSSQWLSAAGPGTVSGTSNTGGAGGGGGGGGLTMDQQIAIGVGIGMGLPSICISFFMCLRAGRPGGGRGAVYVREMSYPSRRTSYV